MDAVAAAWDSDAFVALLGKLVGEAKHLQNGAGVTPTEDRGAFLPASRARCSLTHARAAARHVLDALQPYSTAHGGPLIVRSVSYVEGRSNIIVELKGSDASAGAVSFVGMHLDVVPANPGARYTLASLCCARSW
jgi:acetylornithine deacetylase